MSAAAETINVQEKLSSGMLPEKNDLNHLHNGAANLFAPDSDQGIYDEETNGIHDIQDPRVSRKEFITVICHCCCIQYSMFITMLIGGTF